MAGVSSSRLCSREHAATAPALPSLQAGSSAGGRKGGVGGVSSAVPSQPLRVLCAGCRRHPCHSAPSPGSASSNDVESNPEVGAA